MRIRKLLRAQMLFHGLIGPVMGSMAILGLVPELERMYGLVLGLLMVILGLVSLWIYKIGLFNDRMRKPSQPQRLTNVYVPMPSSHLTSQKLTSLYPPTMPQHLRDAIAVDFEEACTDTKTKYKFYEVYLFETLAVCRRTPNLI